MEMLDFMRCSWENVGFHMDFMRFSWNGEGLTPFFLGHFHGYHIMTSEMGFHGDESACI
jgi:hypothetical protein